MNLESKVRTTGTFRGKQWARFARKMYEGYSAPASYMVPTPGMRGTGGPLPPRVGPPRGPSAYAVPPPRAVLRRQNAMRNARALANANAIVAAAILTDMKALKKKRGSRKGLKGVKKSVKKGVSRRRSPGKTQYTTRSGRVTTRSTYY